MYRFWVKAPQVARAPGDSVRERVAPWVRLVTHDLEKPAEFVFLGVARTIQLPVVPQRHSLDTCYSLYCPHARPQRSRFPGPVLDLYPAPPPSASPSIAWRRGFCPGLHRLALYNRGGGDVRLHPASR